MIIPSLPSSIVQELKEKLQYEAEYEHNNRLWYLAKSNIEEKIEHLPTTSPISVASTLMGPLFNWGPTMRVEQTGKRIRKNNTMIREESIHTNEVLEQPLTTMPLQECQQETTQTSPLESWQTNSSCPFAGIPASYRHSGVIKLNDNQIALLQAARSIPPPKADWKQLNERVLHRQFHHH